MPGYGPLQIHRGTLVSSIVVKLTEGRIDKMAPRAKTYYVRDSKQPGLQIRITPNAVKSFVWYRKVNGKPKRVTLGRHPALAPADARNSARKLEAQRANMHNLGYISNDSKICITCNNLEIISTARNDYYCTEFNRPVALANTCANWRTIIESGDSNG